MLSLTCVPILDTQCQLWTISKVTILLYLYLEMVKHICCASLLMASSYNKNPNPYKGCSFWGIVLLSAYFLIRKVALCQWDRTKRAPPGG